MIALLASFLLATNATPREIVTSCRSAIPAHVQLEGRIVLRNRKGIVKDECAYRLVRQDGATTLEIDGEAYAPTPGDPFRSIRGTDVTWSDLTLDYLWWDDVSFDPKREGESVNSVTCSVIRMRRGDRTVRVWVDRKTGAMMQAEELDGERVRRRLWGRSIRKFGDRWMANVLEVETLGSGHRTKITVEDLK